jgi:hypothetical protein
MSDEREAYRHCGMNPTNNAGPELGFPSKNWDISGFKSRVSGWVAARARAVIATIGPAAAARAARWRPR